MTDYHDQDRLQEAYTSNHFEFVNRARDMFEQAKIDNPEEAKAYNLEEADNLEETDNSEETDNPDEANNPEEVDNPEEADNPEDR